MSIFKTKVSKLRLSREQNKKNILFLCRDEVSSPSMALDLLSDLVADYEEEYYPIAAPTLVETLKLRMYEMGHQVAGHILHTVATTEVDACQ